MKEKDDALASAVAGLRTVSTPRAKMIASERADERRKLAAEQRELQVLRSRLAAVAPAADAWFARWARAGRLELALRARADEPRRRIELPRFHITDKGAVWASEDRRPDRGPYRWYDFALGRTHSLFGGLAGTRMGGPGGDLGSFRTLSELSRKKMKYPSGHLWPRMEADVLLVGLRVAELLRGGMLEPLLVDRLRNEARWMRSVVEREAAELSLIRGEPDGEERYRRVIEEQGITNDVLTADMMVHVTKRVGRRSGR